ncbi:MAG: hypothetical protein M1815_003928 [Lichina confinis]|nr:MAG: hypothetical protein M1815_003928 [Lichina confinis]
MDTAVELPAAANPLSLQTLFSTLAAAASSDQQQVQSATQQLDNWETEPRYHHLLQDLFIDQSLPLDIRYLAVIQLKNGIDKYWRKTATRVIRKEEKSGIRSRLLPSGINEAERRLALQNALIISKVVRFEYPNEWPDVIPSIISHLRSAADADHNHLGLPRTLLILLYVVKELSTARLQRSRSSLQSVTPEIVSVLCAIYIRRFQQWRNFLQGSGEDEGGAVDAIEQTLMILKILRRLLVAGYEFPQRSTEVREFWAVSKTHFGDFLPLVMNETSLAPEIRQHIEKHVLQLSKLHLEMARVHPGAFVLLPDSLEIVRGYWAVVVQYVERDGSSKRLHAGKIISEGDADEHEKPMLEKLGLKSLLLLRACVRLAFNPAPSFRLRKPEEKEELKKATSMVKTELLTESFVRQMMEIIVTRLLIFGENDLREWSEEPEEWERREESEGDGWEFSIRPCAEKLFLDLMIHFKALLVEPMLAVLKTVATNDCQDLLFKDAVYSAVGLSAAVLHQEIDFDGFLCSRLVAEVQETKPGYNILRRRIAIMLGQWVPVRISVDNRPLVYQIFQHFLNKDDPMNDQIVRVTAAKQFRPVADEMEFIPKAFIPFTPQILSSIMALIQEVELTDTKMALLNTVSVIVDRLEHLIAPFAELIVSPLPQLWKQSGQEHLLKQAILSILTKLMNAMKDGSQRYHALVVPLIKHAVEPGSDTQVYLLEDALDLWAAILIQTPDSAAGDVLPLAPYLFHLYELGSEHLRKAFEITESYIILAPSQMLDTQIRSQMLPALASLLGTLKSEANGVISHIVDTIIREADMVGGVQAVTFIATQLAECGLLFKVVDGLRGNWEANQTTGPKKKASSVAGVIETDYFGIISRLALADPHGLCTVLQTVTAVYGEDVGQTMGWLVDEWFSHFGNIGHPTHRKLSCLGLTNMLRTAAPWILGRLQDLMTVWTDVITEVQEGSDTTGTDNLVFQDPQDLAPTEPEPPEDKRRRMLSFADPVRRVNTTDFVRNQLQQSIAACGGQERFRNDWLANVDRDVVSNFGKLEVL